MEREEIEELETETIIILLMAIKVIIIFIGEAMTMQPQRMLNRRPISNNGNNYIRKLLTEEPESFRHLYRMYPSVFLKLCALLRHRTPLKDTRFICVEEMVATFLLIVGHNDRYCNVRQRFGRSHYATSQVFNKVLKALNAIAPQLMAKVGQTIPSKIRGSTRFYPYFKVYMLLLLYLVTTYMYLCVYNVY